MTPKLPTVFLRLPIAHRGYHDTAAGRAENSTAAIRAAVEAGYGIEVDVQLTSDGKPVVFHDADLARLTGADGFVSERTLSEMTALPLTGGGEIPALADCLALVGGRVPLVIEVKDNDERMGPVPGALEAAVAQTLAGYRGPVAVMSFNPHSVARMAELAPDVPRGIVTSAYDPEDWKDTPAPRRDALREIPDYDRVGACFISHEAHDLGRPRVAELKAGGAGVLCWTIRSPEDEAKARRVADNITFEGYAATIPAS